MGQRRGHKSTKLPAIVFGPQTAAYGAPNVKATNIPLAFAK
jgi:hypothetical protein